MVRRWFLALVGVGGVAVLAYLAVAWRPAIAPIDPPVASSFPTELVARGQALASAGGCIDCHTIGNGPVGAGGVPFQRKFGTIFSTNITPDPEAGIGRWSLAAFARALRDGVARDGKHLFPVFPFVHLTKLSDADVGALYAYLMTLPPVKAPARPNTIPFPLDVRALQAAWKAIYLEPGPYRPDPTHDAEWNRGAYLVEGLTHCADCHTPRNLLGAEERGHPYAGALFGMLWATPLDITPSPAPWRRSELAHYLRDGQSETHGTALMAMQKVVRSLRALPDSDIDAIALYMSELMTTRPNHERGIVKALASPEPRDEAERIGSRAYIAACGRCHEQPGATPEAARSPIGLSSALWMPVPNNLLHIILDGIHRAEGVPGPTMPGFRDTLNDVEIGTIAQYLRKTRTTLEPWGEMQVMVPKMRDVPMP
ncbi:Cytochrome c, mono-and diheme variants [Enhydrobacter aerosaccus]|uniref:Cytochrome c, mono-and diheme variants n=1 Tax=Enhydrobacter aerosaccus TaxID=225324 RepID=A0A1T4QFD8_9HYPH|nr:cytochrome c [Enhydrobacter aerosaccus]SKA01948.1 Cytochrome c, mono-and diheme variants [Enhydrobacter aerosaccus]